MRACDRHTHALLTDQWKFILIHFPQSSATTSAIKVWHFTGIKCCSVCLIHAVYRYICSAPAPAVTTTKRALRFKSFVMSLIFLIWHFLTHIKRKIQFLRKTSIFEAVLCCSCVYLFSWKKKNFFFRSFRDILAFTRQKWTPDTY